MKTQNLKMRLILLSAIFFSIITMGYGQKKIEKDIIETQKGPLELWFIGHGTLMFSWNDMVIHIDPVSREADYSTLPDADLVLITHEHGDHLDPETIHMVSTDKTVIICNQASSSKISECRVMKNGDEIKLAGISLKAVPAYNIKHERSPGKPYHPRGNGNGYILDLGGKRIYVAGDTENIPEMNDFKNIDITFLPVNLPYTMSPEMAADAARKIDPEILYPYHFGSTDLDELVSLLKDTDIDIRIRPLQ